MNRNAKEAANAVRATVAAARLLPRQNVEAIARLEKKALRKRTRAERVAESVTGAAGSTLAVVVHTVWFGAWILINTGHVHGIKAFDPFPFNFLTLVVSLEAIFLTLLVLMSQNRLVRQGDTRALLDLQLNMLAEQEGTMTLRTVRKICRHLGVEEEDNCDEIEQLAETTDVEKLVKTIEKNLPK